MSQVRDFFENLENRFEPSAASNLNAIFQYELKEGEVFHFDIQNGECRLAEGEHPAPSITMKLKFETLSKLASGELDGMKAFMFGKLKLSGDLSLATRLVKLFPISK